MANSDMEFTVKVSMIEIYMEKIQDLLDRSKTNLKVGESKERGIFI
jgi:kinesin family member 5